MIERPYYTSDDAEGQASLLGYSARSDGRCVVVLGRALFHPQGGRQPVDAGWTDDEQTETVLACGDDVVHIAARPLLPGIVNLRVDVTLRQLHARLYSAGHLIGLTGIAFDWLPVKAHRWPNEGHTTFAVSEDDVLLNTLSLQKKVNAWQADNLSRQVTFIDGLRQAGSDHLLAYPCGGIHIARFSEVGSMTIIQVKMKKGRVIVNYTLVP